MNDQMKYMLDAYSSSHLDELYQFIRDLAIIPAPTGNEHLRAEYIQGWLQRKGFKDAFIDAAGNVECPIGITKTNNICVFTAHMDVVFPDTDKLPFKEDDEYFYAPGVGDNTACLAVLLHSILYFAEHKLTPQEGILIVADTCEEGLGNLKGCRYIVDTYQNRISGFISVDGTLDVINARGVGSHRYNISVKTEGGHSYNNFGNTSAIAVLSKIINELYSIQLPEKTNTKTTYNVGTVSGGTTINSIAADASMLYEYRSNDADCLQYMEDMLTAKEHNWEKDGYNVTITKIGDRPSGCLEPLKEAQFLKPILEHAKDAIGYEPAVKAGSTDANYPLSKGIPSACLGACIMFNGHRRDEYLKKDSLIAGFRFILYVLSDYFIK